MFNVQRTFGLVAMMVGAGVNMAAGMYYGQYGSPGMVIGLAILTVGMALAT